jgi:ELWxxDGT repeat protein
MVLDINTNTLSANPSELAVIGPTTYFAADDGLHGRELWKSDGTAAGTALVKDLYPGGIGSDLRSLTAANGTLFFTTYESAQGTKLWKSDGTAAGTVLVMDIFPTFSGPVPASLAAVNGVLFFPAYDGVHGTELWRTDGTAAGTVLVKDLNPGSNGSSPGSLAAVNGTLFFVAYVGVRGIELWKSDGSAAGTDLVKDVRPGFDGAYPTRLTNVNGTLFFAANDGTHGEELWTSNGTAAGTVLVKDVDPRTAYGVPHSSTPTELTAVNGTLFFSAFSDRGRELWKSNGTTAGTVLVRDIDPDHGSYPRSLTAVNGTLFFSASDGTHFDELWKSDGTAAGTVMVEDINPDPVGASNPGSLAYVNGTLYFTVAYTNVNGTPSSKIASELWKSDGTAAGTVMVKEFFRGNWYDPLPRSLTNANGTLLFVAGDGRHGVELWKSDGTAAGTARVKDINARTVGSQPGNLTNVNGTLYFAADDGAHGMELWKSDGTVAGTTLVKDIVPGGSTGYYGGYYPFGSSPGNFTNVNGRVFFTAWNPGTGPLLWKTDGTEAGTVLVAQTNAGNLTAVGDTLFFTSGATTFGDGVELWKSDGTAAGTTMVKDINPGFHYEYGYWGTYIVPNNSFPDGLTNVNGTLFFSAEEGENGRELWTSDGTAAGTVLFKDVLPGVIGSNPSPVTAAGGSLFFTANASATGRELWRSDGTAAGTALVKDIRPGSTGSYPNALTVVNGTIYFRASDGTTGNELWKSNGTAAGTVLVKDIATVSGGSYPASLTNVNGTLFFSAFGDTTGRELWKSDGTAAGTVLVKDLNPGGWGDPQNLTVANGVLLFSASDGLGWKLWQSNGTAAGTVVVANLAAALTAVNGTLFFPADDGVHGQELWVLVEDNLPSVSIGDATVTEGHAGTRSATFTVTLSAASDQPVTVTYATADGTAAGSDYQAASGALTFAPGATSKTVTVLVNGDRSGEPNETFVVNLSSPTNATITDGQGVGTILDDEPRISIGDVTKYEGRKGRTTLFTFTVMLSAAYDQPVTMSFQTANGTATTGDSDYVAKSGTLTFAPGEMVKTITVEVKGDSKREAAEYFYLDLFGSSGNSLFADSRGLGTILNDD